MDPELDPDPYSHQKVTDPQHYWEGPTAKWRLVCSAPRRGWSYLRSVLEAAAGAASSRETTMGTWPEPAARWRPVRPNLAKETLLITVPHSVGDPDPEPDLDTHVFGPPRSGSISQRSGSGSFTFLIKVLSGLKRCLQNKILTQNFGKTSNF
jgi:hypothetical protein